jgi:hypothetical protein
MSKEIDKMKKLTITVIAALAIIMAACSAASPKLESSPYGAADELTDISMTVREGTVGRQAESVALTITNLSGKEYMFGAPFELEKEIDGVWHQCPPKEEMAFIMIAYILEPHGMAEEAITLHSFFGVLEPGTYRVVKSFNTENDTGGVAFGVFAVE